jgi:type II secretory pathway component PulL
VDSITDPPAGEVSALDAVFAIARAAEQTATALLAAAEAVIATVEAIREQPLPTTIH